ncbi:uncharacterized protein BP5553_01613 [Venustampulla echinocandica]|uniref:Carboxylic ester hydrolase n=1 Tax=Venustampulla echinocandica TaxID=2656787 RepID=A0A370U1I7_9HELO|nr:uncharacterized protein BP5553_01613 [Venustampulla echinocandica]RDL41634.1 hypothetical protein BP5553_01613 [Venustampulla echinocandica]
MATFWAFAAILFSSLFALVLGNGSSLPIVDLGYENGEFYNFSNIRYGQAPVGNLRFRALLAPVTQSNIVNNGSVGVTCPQVVPPWQILAGMYLGSRLSNTSFDLAAAEAAVAAMPPQPLDPKTSEDCLFLDVFVPRAVFPKNSHGSGKGAPVLVWITGGGFIAGDKTAVGDQLYSPEGLIKASQTAPSKGLIFVSINYRLGAFGFLAGSEVEADGNANAGLHDQRLALEWVQNNIHLFGGDKGRVTVMGESGGGSSIMHQITAFGGKSPLPFTQAIMQSPAFISKASNWQNEVTFKTFLNHLNVSSLQEARNLPSENLINGNIAQISAGGFVDFSYGPTVDGTFTPGIPQRLLSSGAFKKNVNVMVAYNSWEGGLFQSPYVTNLSTLTDLIKVIIPRVSPGALSEITDGLYPPVFGGFRGYKTWGELQAQLTADAALVCGTTSISRAFGNQTYAYEFAIAPGIHGQDMAYTFATGPDPSIDYNVAKSLQQYITSFVDNGTPVAIGSPAFPKYGPDNKILKFGHTISQTTDPAANERCEWWNKALYY